MEELTKEADISSEPSVLAISKHVESLFEELGIAPVVPYPPGLATNWARVLFSSLENTTVQSLSALWISANLPTLQIKSVTDLAGKVFESPEIAKEWLQEPNLATDNKPPIALLGTEEGFSRVQTLLRRIEYGVLA